MSLDTVNQQGSRTSNLERPKCRGACPRNGGCFIHSTGKPWLGFNGLGWYDNRARVLDALTGRFTTPDPLCERRTWESPYLWCAGNPVRYVDPSGMDIWMIDERGSIQSYEKTMDFDAVRIVDGQGNTMIGKDGSTGVWIIHKI